MPDVSDVTSLRIPRQSMKYVHSSNLIFPAFVSTDDCIQAFVLRDDCIQSGKGGVNSVAFALKPRLSETGKCQTRLSHISCVKRLHASDCDN